MALQACLRCGSLDLAMPGAADGVSYEGGQLLASTCRACGLTGPPMLFEDQAAWQRFREERAALYHPSPAPASAPTFEVPPAPELPTGAGPRSAGMRALAALVGGVFVLGALAALVTAAATGAWVMILPSALLSLLLGVPILAMARRRA